MPGPNLASRIRNPEFNSTRAHPESQIGSSQFNSTIANSGIQRIKSAIWTLHNPRICSIKADIHNLVLHFCHFSSDCNTLLCLYYIPSLNIHLIFFTLKPPLLYLPHFFQYHIQKLINIWLQFYLHIFHFIFFYIFYIPIKIFNIYFISSYTLHTQQ